MVYLAESARRMAILQDFGRKMVIIQDSEARERVR